VMEFSQQSDSSLESLPVSEPLLSTQTTEGLASSKHQRALVQSTHETYLHSRQEANDFPQMSLKPSSPCVPGGSAHHSISSSPRTPKGT
jgi:hypothetical protein